MLFSFAVSALLYLSSTVASPLASRASTCTAMLEGNLSPNGNYGNFKILNGAVVWDPNNIADGFWVSLMSCGAAEASNSNGNESGELQATTGGQCLSVASESTIQAVTCPSGGAAASSATNTMTWSMYEGFLFWSGPTSTACPSGLYGYIATDASGIPAAPQDTPLTLGCLTAPNVFGFSLLD
ncbi:hypothetical protein Clacol_004840 [Clathrus columnatus]|uniref:Uncharacterized protein n=1 Tax=Clathrus columnatus TaxID=1419009 RepID=A0AAV5ABS8_9AGAM|nr:hypothetical protein Clacol_004840 [Clathrus columnatus]